jgi:hypothetical protein
MHSPRGAEARLQHLFAAQHSREDAAHVRVREMRDREAQRQHLSRAEKMTKQRLEAQMAARLLHQQAQWRTLLVLSASALTLGQVIEPRREQRKFETAGMLIKVRLKRMMTRKREQKMAQTKSALNAVLWISHLNRQVKAKKQGAGVIAEFLISIAQQSLLPVSARVFM